MRVLSPNKRFRSFYVDVVHTNIPFIIGLMELNAHGLLLNYIDDATEHSDYGGKRPIRYRNGHSFLGWNCNASFLKRCELRRLHLYLLKFKRDTLFQLIRPTQPETTKYELRLVLHKNPTQEINTGNPA